MYKNISSKILIAAVLTIGALFSLLSVAHAQEEPGGRFASYDEMRASLDDLMSKRRIVDLLTAFGGADEMSFQDMTALEAQVRSVFPEDFANDAVMIRRQYEGGFAQEMIAYWSDDAYIYVRLLYHDRAEAGVFSINMTFNSDPDVLIPLF